MYRGGQGDDAYGEDPYAEDRDLDDPDRPAPPYWFAGQHLPPDARRMGLTHHVPDGAILDFAGHLDSAKLGHRVTAWALLLLFVLPVVLSALRVLYTW
jgi:hypothetical protein